MVCVYAGKEYSIGEVIEAGDFKRCAAMALKALEHDKDCGQPKVRTPSAHNQGWSALAAIKGNTARSSILWAITLSMIMTRSGASQNVSLL